MNSRTFETRTSCSAWARSINQDEWVDMAAFQIGGSAHLGILPKRRGTRATNRIKKRKK
jgi:hypothetical protein